VTAQQSGIKDAFAQEELVLESIQDKFPPARKHLLSRLFAPSQNITQVTLRGKYFVAIPTGVTNNGCHVVSHCHSRSGGIQLCTFECQ